jgi:AcrR family transcriptional regulator
LILERVSDEGASRIPRGLRKGGLIVHTANNGKKRTKGKTAKLLSREEWLSRSLEVLAEKGGQFRIEELARSLGVSKGSFYWHFESRADFVVSVTEYWADYFTTRVVREVGKVDGDARARLRALMEIVTREKLSKYDLAFLSWAAHSPEVARVVKRVFRQRLHYVGSLFSEMGFTGDDLETRTQAFVSFMMAQGVGIFPRETHRQMVEKLTGRHRFFTR